MDRVMGHRRCWTVPAADFSLLRRSGKGGRQAEGRNVELEEAGTGLENSLPLQMASGM